MSKSLPSRAIAHLPWTDVERHLQSDARLIVPVGEFDQHGPHLPIGATNIIVEALVDEVSREFGVLRAPLFPFGVNRPTRRSYAGAASLRQKTFHRALNDLLADWEDRGFCEFILITAFRHAPHVEAMATVSVQRARVRVVEALGIDLSEFLASEPGPQHGGEIETSLLLHLRPECVRMEAAVDYRLEPDRFKSFTNRGLPSLPPGCQGAVGQPTLASAAKGERIYQHILARIRDKIFLAPPDEGAGAP